MRNLKYLYLNGRLGSLLQAPGQGGTSSTIQMKHRFSTWNIDNKLDASPIIGLVWDGNISFLSLQEPSHRDHPGWKTILCKQFEGNYLGVIESRFQYIILCILNIREILEETMMLMGGQIISFILEIVHGKHLGILEEYGVTGRKGEHIQMTRPKTL